jgi:hypothetical protein
MEGSARYSSLGQLAEQRPSVWRCDIRTRPLLPGEPRSLFVSTSLISRLQTKYQEARHLLPEPRHQYQDHLLVLPPTNLTTTTMCASRRTPRGPSVFLHPFLQQHLTNQEAARAEAQRTEESAASPTTPNTTSPRDACHQDMEHQSRTHRRNPSHAGSIISEPEDK